MARPCVEQRGPQERGLPSIESILLQVQLHWADHVIRMEDVCMPKEVFFATSASVKKESVIVVLQESVTMIS